jgi:hypothetical protein
VVENYIQEQIMAKTNTHAEAVNDGLNALKNAYDDQFKEKLVEMGPKMLDFKYYYKGYSYIPHPYYYFEYVETSRTAELNNKLEYWNNPGQYFDLYLKDWPNRKANVFNADFGQSLIYKQNDNDIVLNDFKTVYVKTISEDGKGSHLFEEYPIHFQMKDLFDLENSTYSSVSEIPENSNLGKLCDNLKNSNSIVKLKIKGSKNKRQKVKTNEPVNYKSKYALFNGNLTGVDRDNLWKPQDISKVTNKRGWGVKFWRQSRYSKNQPPWCNVFASDLSNYIYGKVNGNYPVPYGSGNYNAEKIYNHFNSDKNYEEIKNSESKIWKFINAGYPVYFITKTHIETGFPDKSKNKGNKKYFHSSLKYNYNNPSSNFCTIGAGTYVGYKTYKEYYFLDSDDTKKVLYLEYLKKNY